DGESPAAGVGRLSDDAVGGGDRFALSRGGAGDPGARPGGGRGADPRDHHVRQGVRRGRRRSVAGVYARLGYARGMARAGELLIVGFEGKTAPGDLLARIAAGRVGGVVLFARNLGTPDEVAALTGALQGAAPADAPPLLISVDQEGGRVQRIKAPLTVWP